MYRLQFLGKAQVDLKRIDRAYQKIIKEKLLLLVEHPESLKISIKRLKGSKREYYRLKVGSYRIIFKKEKKRLVIVIIRIGHRKEVCFSLDLPSSHNLHTNVAFDSSFQVGFYEILPVPACLFRFMPCFSS